MKHMSKLFKEPKGIMYHGGALLYVLLMYSGGIVGLFQSSWIINFVCMLCLAHGMTIAAYLIHESGHNTIFRSNENNAKLGKFLTWVCGACYATFEDIRYKHFRHHVDNDDVVWFDYMDFFRRHVFIRKVIEFLEWFYIPAHDLLMHAIMVFSSFIIPQRREQRKHNIIAILVRGIIFFSVLYLNTKVAILYMVAYMIMMQILRFMDSLQHDYGYHLTLFSDEKAPYKGDSEYELAHTFSNPHSLKYDWLNWFTLNFGYHNAHHARPIVPWYRLPALHRELYGDGDELFIPFLAQLKMFHNFRVERVFFGEAREEPMTADAQEEYNFLEEARAAKVSGGNAASFLTAF